MKNRLFEVRVFRYYVTLDLAEKLVSTLLVSKIKSVVSNDIVKTKQTLVSQNHFHKNYTCGFLTGGSYSAAHVHFFAMQLKASMLAFSPFLQLNQLSAANCY